MLPNLFAISTEYLNHKSIRTNIPYSKRLDDGLSILKHLKAGNLCIDAYHILTVLVADAYRPGIPLPTKLFNKHPDAYNLAKQCFDILTSYSTHNFDLVPSINLEFHPTWPQLKHVITAFIVPCYVDFSIAVTDNIFTNVPPGFIANRVEYFNIFLSKLGVDETNFEHLRECVSRGYPWE